MFRPASIAILIATPVILGSRLWAQDGDMPPPEDVERMIEEILELRGQAEALLEALPPELREEVERRWLELQATAAEIAAAEVPRGDSLDPAATDPRVPLPADANTSEPEPRTTLEPEPAGELAASSEEVPEPESEPVPAKECDSLALLDTTGDGVVSASDRNWRYLRLRADMGGRSTNMGDLESLYDLGIREIDVNLRFFKMADGSAGDITVGDRVRFEVPGKRRSTGRSMILFIEAGRLARGGGVAVVDGTGTPLVGDQPLAPGVALQTAEGRRQFLLCP